MSARRDFLVEIGAAVPYYRELFARIGFDPRAVRGPAEPSDIRRPMST